MRGWLIGALAFGLLGQPAAAGEVIALGSGDGIDVLKTVAASFMAANPDIRVNLPPSSGSTGGIASVVSDMAVLGRVARPLTEREKAQGLEVTPIVRFPAVFYVHPSVGLKSLTAAQTVGLFSGAIDNWKEIGGPDLRVRVVRREEGESALVTMRNSVSGWKNLVLTERSKLETNTAAMLETVLDTPGGVGFASFAPSYVARGLIAVDLDGVAPLQPAYPAHQTLTLVYKPERLTPDAKRFLDFLKTPQAAAAIHASGAGVPAQ